MNDVLQRVSTGIQEFDEMLSGGLIPGSAYLVRGGPGQGKTTLGLHFLSAGEEGETGLFIGFQEPSRQVIANAKAVGIDLSSVEFLDLTPDETFFAESGGYDLFTSGDVETEPLANAVVKAVESHRPSRVVIDSMTQLRFLSADSFQYRKQVLSFLHLLKERNATVLFTSERSSEHPDDDLQFLADGVITLGHDSSGGTLEVSKFRGSGFRRGIHQVNVGDSGLQVFPRPMPPKYERPADASQRWSTGLERFDGMLYGGLESGTITMISGPSGVGKSTVAALFACGVASQGGSAAVFAFEEDLGNLLIRTDALGVPLRERREDGSVWVEQVEPMRYLADEFAWAVNKRVEERNLDLVVLDSTAGYELTLGGAQETKTSLHAFAKSLSRAGVSVILVNETESVTGAFRISEKGISYLVDNVIVLRYMENEGRLLKVLGVLKKRLSPFDSRLHPFELGAGGLLLGEPLHTLQGALTGTPVTVEAY